MATRGPWSVKGIEAKAREAAVLAARSEGVTLGDYLNRLLLEAEGEDADMSLSNGQTAQTNEQTSASLEALERLTRRIEAVEARSTLAITGIDQSVVGMLSRLENSDSARNALEGRLEQAAEDLRQTQSLLEARINRVEADDSSAQNLRSLKLLETALERLAGSVAEQKASTEKAENTFSRIDTRMDDLSGSVDTRLNDMALHVERTLENASDSVSKVVEKAELRTEGAAKHLSERMSKLEADLFEEKRKHADKFKSMETRIDGTLSGVTDQIDRLSDSMTETLKQSQQALSEARKQEASIETIAERLNRAETTTDAAMRELEHHFNRLDSRLEEFDRDLDGGRISDLKLIVEDRIKSASQDLAGTIADIRAEMAEQIESASAAPNAAFAEINTVVSEMHKRMRSAERRQSDAIEAIASEFARLTEKLDRRVRQIEERNDSELGSAVRQQIDSLASNFHKRITELEDRDPGDNDSLHAVSQQMNDLADVLEKRVQTSEERSAAAIREFTEHVTTLTKSLSAKQEQGIRDISGQIRASEERQSKRMDDALMGVRERIAQVEQATASAVSPIQKAMAGFVERLQAVEDFATPPGMQSAHPPALDLPSFESTLKKVSEPSGNRPEKAAPVSLPDTSSWDVFDTNDRPVERHQGRKTIAAKEPVQQTDDPWALEGDDLGLSAAARSEDTFDVDDNFAADLPPIDKEFDLNAADTDFDTYNENFGREPAGPNDYLARARAAANAGHESSRSAMHSPKRPKVSKGGSKLPLVAAASVLALTAAGTIGVMSMRGKQDQNKEPIVAVPNDVTAADLMADLDDSIETQVKTPDSDDDGIRLADAEKTPVPDLSEKTPESQPAKAETKTIKAEPSPTPVKTDPVVQPTPAPKNEAALPPPPDNTLFGADDAVSTPPVVSVPVQQFQMGMTALDEGRIAEAASLITKAAEAGEPAAQYRLAKLYERGQGVPRDLVQSRQWTEKAARGGNVKAMHDLAVFLAEGEGGPQSYPGAVQWFRQAADHGLLDSQYNLGILYEQGLGVTENKAEALYWFRVAQKLGDPAAAKKVMELVDQVSEEEAVKTALLAGKYQPKPSDPAANGQFSSQPQKTAAGPASTDASADMVRDAQVLLNALGYNAGAADGQLGSLTREAILIFQSANGLPQSGTVTPTLLRQLRVAAARI